MKIKHRIIGEYGYETVNAWRKADFDGFREKDEKN
jgi:hypothetical protein